ncbi:ArnT family glycosyltransferase [Dictyobacter aurantiacus]|uniref:Glycosyltransferase RgtA/B/C/D-like domain-containing protein n=1 Tax=Dictyobacter aurantiacus TaxID=1936993 RepID=A0A401ZFV1_9CHLR|nr:hypothetical protein [Dictyobacter aurantiacus]GCE05747.1 hypothetical protein KDAU_30760 [Dictyobacter aurantiacus]
MLNILLGRRKTHSYGLVATCIIAFALMLRILLILLHWPATNSDESVMALIANDIAYHGKTPVIFYGQDYMGLIEAYLGALFYHLTGGLSITALRLGVVLLMGVFFVVMYHLTRLLYSPKLALLTLAILSVSTLSYVGRLVLATGGSAETLVFGALSFLLAARLSYTYQRHTTVSSRLRRLPGYLCFGIIVGLGIWSDMVGAPLYLMATLLLLVFCWREIFIYGGWLIGLVGGAIGLLPTILYALQNPGKSLLGGLLSQAEGAPLDARPEQLTLWHKVVETFQVSLPTATGSPFCPVIEYPFMGDNTRRSLTCGIIQSSWSLGYILLMAASIAIAIAALTYLKQSQKGLSQVEQHRQQVSYVARLCLLGAAVLSILIYINSAGPVDQPGYHARYLVSLFVVTPAMLAPLYYAARSLREGHRWARVRFYGSRAILGALIMILIAGTGMAFIEIPKAHAEIARRQHLIDQLNALHVSYLYTDYWTCYSLVVATINTRHPIVCSVIDNQGSPRHERIPAFRVALKNSKRSPFMCATDFTLTTRPLYDCLPYVQALVKKTNDQIGRYFVRHKLDGYILYRPEPKS